MTLKFRFRSENAALRAAALFRLMQQDGREWTETRQFDLLRNLTLNSTLEEDGADLMHPGCPAQDNLHVTTP